MRRASGGSPLALTEVGKRLLSLSATVETAVNAAQVAVESIAGAGTESFRVGLDLPVPQVAQAIAAIQTRHEGVLIEVVSGLRTEECLRSLDSCRFDLVLVRLPIARLGVEVRQIIESPYVAVLPPQSALANSSEPVGLEELGHHALIAVDWDPAISSLHLCSPTIVVSSVHLALAAINEGAGVGVLPGVIVAGDGQHPNVRPLRDCLSPLRVGACVRADEESPGIASAFLTELAAAVEPDLR